MKFSFLLGLTLITSAAFADQYSECKLIGQTDSRVGYTAPKQVELNESDKWHFYVNDKRIKDASVIPSRTKVLVSYDRIKQGLVLNYRFIFDMSRCDSKGVGEASLVVNEIGALDSKGDLGNGQVSLYDCQCAVD